MGTEGLPTVAVLMGGPSREHAVSLKSGAAVAQALVDVGCRVYEVVFNEPELPEMPDDVEVVFPVLHGRFGEDGEVQKLLEAKGLAYVGCGVEASEIVIDKHEFKRYVRRAGGRPTLGALVKDDGATLAGGIRFPLIIKPNREGSTIGLSLVQTPDQWLDAMDLAMSVDDSVLLEEYVRGIECTVGVLEGKALPMVEIIPPNELFDHDAKYEQTQGETVYNCPPTQIGEADEEKAARLAEEIYNELDARDMLRVDMILADSDGDFRVLEANSMPGFTATSLFPKAAAAAGIEFPELCLRLVRLASGRRS
jgi:D-alanine-D-alanine ligase